MVGLTAFRSNKYLWLWVPAFAGTTHSMDFRRFNFFQTATFLADTPSRSRRGFAREFYLNFPSSEDQRAQGVPGARCTRSLACKIKKHTSVVTTVTPERPGIPRAMVLRLTSRSPR